MRVHPDGATTVVADDLDFPNGMVITPGGGTLVVAESSGRRLTSFAVGEDGGLSDRAVFADGLEGPPDGIALDAVDGVWASLTLAHRFDRVVAGGTVTDRIEIAQHLFAAHPARCAGVGAAGAGAGTLPAPRRHPLEPGRTASARRWGPCSTSTGRWAASHSPCWCGRARRKPTSRTVPPG